MKIHLIAYGIAKDILKSKKMDFEINEHSTIGHLKEQLTAHYPDFEKLKSFSMAVGEDYQNDNYVLTASEEVVIIPPVSGG